METKKERSMAWAIVALVGVAFLIIGGVIVYVSTRPDSESSTTNSSTTTSMSTATATDVTTITGVPTTPPLDPLEAERRFDGKDPRKEDIRCADRPAPPSLPVYYTPIVSVAVPDGEERAVIDLRKSQVPSCATVIWARVLWGGRMDREYRIPSGWTFHIVGRRPVTGTTAETTEKHEQYPIPYGLSSMLVTARGCVEFEVFFTSDSGEKTAPAKTTCEEVK